MVLRYINIVETRTTFSTISNFKCTICLIDLVLLKSLRLKNIRSYLEQDITFPEGIVLLAGDIGAGKSTILLAIEFALFGLLRGELSGSALLRNGAREGKVELSFMINDRTYTIGRTLKRTKTSVEQDAGYLVEDGLRRELTAIELKAAVLHLLGYPDDLLTKSKSLIYRYTVYTPQEEMKRIILDDTESRLVILRKVFDIEKYRRISDNANTYAKLLRERKRAYEGQLVDEPLKQQQWEQKHQDARVVQQALLDIQPRLNTARQAVREHKAGLEAFEQQRAALHNHRASLQATEAELIMLAQHHQQTQTEIAQLANAQQEIAPVPALQDITQSLQQKQQELQLIDQEVNTHIAAHAELRATRQLSESTLRKIMALEHCPTCLQMVDPAHKHQIAEQEQQKAQSLATQLESYEHAVMQSKQKKQRILQELTTLQQHHAAAQTAQVKLQHAQLNQQRKQQLEIRLAQITAARTTAEARKQSAVAQLHTLPDLEQRFLTGKQQLDVLLRQEQQVVVEHATLVEHAKHLRETLTLLDQDLTVKRQVRKQLEQLNVLHHWVDEFFSGLMTVMEKHVMTKVYHDFNAFFQQWFGLLIEDEVLVARLDETFSPIVQQNGYDIEVMNLSGGEKTACALAYRLALNRVITHLRSGIHTKDALILDEPTDGFSAGQIERLRDVLEQLRARQILLVSHEAAIESLADHVLRVVKEEHTSKIVA